MSNSISGTFPGLQVFPPTGIELACFRNAAPKVVELQAYATTSGYKC